MYHSKQHKKRNSLQTQHQHQHPPKHPHRPPSMVTVRSSTTSSRKSSRRSRQFDDHTSRQFDRLRIQNELDAFFSFMEVDEDAHDLEEADEYKDAVENHSLQCPSPKNSSTFRSKTPHSTENASFSLSDVRLSSFLEEEEASKEDKAGGEEPTIFSVDLHYEIPPTVTRTTTALEQKNKEEIESATGGPHDQQANSTIGMQEQLPQNVDSRQDEHVVQEQQEQQQHQQQHENSNENDRNAFIEPSTSEVKGSNPNPTRHRQTTATSTHASEMDGFSIIEEFSPQRKEYPIDHRRHRNHHYHHSSHRHYQNLKHLLPSGTYEDTPEAPPDVLMISMDSCSMSMTQSDDTMHTSKSQLSYDDAPTITPSIAFFLNANKKKSPRNDSSQSSSPSPNHPANRKFLYSSSSLMSIDDEKYHNTTTTNEENYDDDDESQTAVGYSKASSKYTTDTPRILELREKKRLMERYHEVKYSKFPALIEIAKNGSL